MSGRTAETARPEFLLYAPYSRFQETHHRTPWLMFPRSFADLGFDPTLVCGRMEYAPDRVGLRVVETGVVASSRPPRRFLQALLDPFLAFATIWRRKPAVVMIGPMGPPLLTTLPLVWLYRHLPGNQKQKATRFVLKTDANLFDYGVGPGGSRLMDLLLVAATHAFHLVTAETVCSLDRARALPGVRRESLVRVPNGYPQGQIDLRAYGRPEGRAKRILCVARIVPYKGQEVLLRAFARLASDFPEWTVLILGDRVDEAFASRLESTARAPPLTGRVKFGGFRTVVEVDREFASAAIFCLPTLHESSGSVKYEATVLGAPVVTTDVPCAADSIEAGWRVARAGDAEQLGDRLRELMGDDELRRQAVALAQSKVRSYLDRARELLHALGRTVADAGAERLPPG